MNNHDQGWKKANEFAELPFNCVQALAFVLSLIGVLFLILLIFAE